MTRAKEIMLSHTEIDILPNCNKCDKPFKHDDRIVSKGNPNRASYKTKYYHINCAVLVNII